MSKITDLKEIASNYSVLYVEDNDTIAESFKYYLDKIFNKVYYFTNGLDAIENYKKVKQDIVITDIQMPLMDGLEMSEKIKEINENQNILITSAYSDNEKFLKSIKIGVDGYIIKPINYEDLNKLLYKIVNKIKKFEEHTLYKKSLEKSIKKKTIENLKLNYEKIDTYEKTLYALIDIIESRDAYTGKHSLRVANYSKLIAKKIGLNKKECEELYKACILHDIGKVAIPDSLLLKPTRLDENEFNLIKEHVNIGFHILFQIPMFKNMAEIIKGHHERLDGSGYPDGLKGNQISLQSNIIALADCFDAMTTNRIYKSRKSKEEALEEISSLSNISFKKEIVDAALIVLKDIEIDININQLPKTSLEKERFSYFYKDSLTNLFNAKYLDFLLSKNQDEKTYTTLNLIFIHNFSKYNKKYGWTKGDTLLKDISVKLTQIQTDSFLFRIHGDDFIILDSNNSFNENKLKELQEYISNYSKDLILSSKKFDLKKEKISSLAQLEEIFFS